jgi:hypothetical protein
MKDYTYKDGFGGELEIRSGEGGCALVDMGTDDRARVSADDLPEVAGKLYEACGRSSPVILDRPSIRIPADGGPLFCGDLSLRMHEGGISMGLPGIPGITAAAVSPDALRRRAAFMAAYADAAEAEPDPAEVDRVARIIHKASCACGSQCVAAPEGDDLKAGRAVVLDQLARARGQQ